MSIVNVVRDYRRRATVTQEDLGRRCGVSRQTIIALEAHAHVPTLRLALRLARELGVTVEELFQLHEASEGSEPDAAGRALSR